MGSALAPEGSALFSRRRLARRGVGGDEGRVPVRAPPQRSESEALSTGLGDGWWTGGRSGGLGKGRRGGGSLVFHGWECRRRRSGSLLGSRCRGGGARRSWSLAATSDDDVDFHLVEDVTLVHRCLARVACHVLGVDDNVEGQPIARTWPAGRVTDPAQHVSRASVRPASGPPPVPRYAVGRSGCACDVA